MVRSGSGDAGGRQWAISMCLTTVSQRLASDPVLAEGGDTGLFFLLETLEAIRSHFVKTSSRKDDEVTVGAIALL